MSAPAASWTIRFSIRRMPAPFPEAALPVLRNPQLRKNVAHAIDVIQAKRAQAGGGKDGLAGAALGSGGDSRHALENLGAYLEQFEERCTAAGGAVHWAADAAEARQIILDILREEKAARGHQDQDHDFGGDSAESVS